MSTRYKAGDKFIAEAQFRITDVDEGFEDIETTYHLVLTVDGEEYYDEWLTEAEMDDIVNPVAKLIELRKQQEAITKSIAKLEGKING